MDAKLFRLPTEPTYYTNLSESQSKQAFVQRLTPKGVYAIAPVPDARYPGWAAPMQDAAVLTDYRTHCSGNIPAGMQYSVHLWSQRNADAIINLSRERQSINTGANLGFDNTIVPPPASVVQCDAFGCSGYSTNLRNGIGQERQEHLPPLFGTFNTNVPLETQQVPPITRRFEGGRNSARGRSFEALGTAGVGSANLGGTFIRAA